MFDPYFIYVYQHVVLQMFFAFVAKVVWFGSGTPYCVAIGKADSRSKLTNSQLQPIHSGI